MTQVIENKPRRRALIATLSHFDDPTRVVVLSDHPKVRGVNYIAGVWCGVLDFAGGSVTLESLPNEFPLAVECSLFSEQEKTLCPRPYRSFWSKTVPAMSG
jgi:hypothetical protein